MRQYPIRASDKKKAFCNGDLGKKKEIEKNWKNNSRGLAKSVSWGDKFEPSVLDEIFPSSAGITKRRSRRLEKSRHTRSVCGEYFLIFPDPHTSHVYYNGGLYSPQNHISPLKKHLNFSDPRGYKSRMKLK